MTLRRTGPPALRSTCPAARPSNSSRAVRIEATSAGLQGVVTSTHPATRFVLDGTRPHIIRPRRAKALRFEIGARVVFARLVHHPGTRPNNFLERALREGR